MNAHEVFIQIERIAFAPGKNDKIALLKEGLADPLFKRVVVSAYDPRVTYGMRDIPGHSDHDVWNAAWQACLEHAEFLPAFAQEYRGTFTRPQTKAKVGDTVSNRRTDHRSKIVEALERSDGRIYAILESRIHCVIPSPNWEIMENA